MRKPRRARQGFTIMEILIAILAITIAILGTLAAIAFGLRASKLGSENTVAIQINRKVIELILQGIYPVATGAIEPAFNHAPAAITEARGGGTWRPIFLGPSTPRWFSIQDYGFIDGTPDADKFRSDTSTFELDVSAVQMSDPVPLKVDNRFIRIVVQTRWQDKGRSDWKVVRTETFGIP